MRVTKQEFKAKFRALVSYLECLYLLESLDGEFYSKNVNLQRPTEESFSVRTPPPLEQDKQFNFKFYPICHRPNNYFKLDIEVAMHNFDPQPYQEIVNTFRNFFHMFIVPDDEDSTNQATPLKNFFELINYQMIWHSMRLHELMYLQLQFFAQTPDPNPYTGLPKNLKFVQQTH